MGLGGGGHIEEDDDCCATNILKKRLIGCGELYVYVELIRILSLKIY